MEDTLWNAVTRGDKQAFEQLFELYYPPLLIYAKKYIDNVAACEDVVQDVFVTLWEGRRTISIQTSIRSYLVVAVRNRCYNLLQKEWFARRYHDYAMQKELLRIISDENDDGDFYLLTELYQLLEDTLSKLPDVCRTVFEMQVFEKLSFDEIAAKLNVSVRTAKRYKKVAIDSLRNMLKDYTDCG